MPTPACALRRRAPALASSLVLTVLVLTACGGGSEGPTATPQCTITGVSITPAATQMLVGESTPLAATVAHQHCASTTVNWSSSDASIASVSSSGVVTGVAAGGPVTISAGAGSATGTAQVTVAAPPCTITGITVAPPVAQVVEHQTVTLVASVQQQHCANPSIAWTTSNPAIATVADGGVVTGVLPGGPVTITATVGTFSASTQLTVTPAPVAAIQLVSGLPAERFVGQGDSVYIHAFDAQGNQLVGRTATFTSSNPAVASVSPQGLVNPLALGGPLWIHAASGGRRDSIALEVIAPATNRLAYAWAHDPASMTFYNPIGSWAFSSNGRLPRLRKVGAGTYQVHFPGFSNTGGQTEAVLTTAYGTSDAFCKPVSWNRTGANILAVVRCYTAAGQLTDSRFTIALVGSGALDGRVGFAWLHDPASAAPYAPSSGYRFNSAGGAISASQVGSGSYQSIFSQLGRVGGSLPEVFLAVAYGGGATSCQVVSWNNNPDMSASIQCVQPDASNAETQMVALTVERGRAGKRHAVVWASQPTADSYLANNGYSWTSAGTTPSVVRNSAGSYRVTLPGLAKVGGAPETVLASAYGGVPGRCKVQEWNNAGADMAVDVVCHSLAGVLTDLRFNLLLIE